MTQHDPIRLAIAVVQLGRLGDMILTTPLLRALKEAVPKCHVTLVASEHAASIAKHLSCVDDIIEVSGGPLGLAGGMLRVSMHALDIYIDPKDHRSSSSRALLRVARAPRIIAHSTNTSRRHEQLPPAGPHGHYVDRMLAPLTLIAPGAEPDRRPSIELPAAFTDEAARVRTTVGDTYAVMNVSAGASLRQPSFAQSEVLLRWLSGKLPVVIVSAPEDRRAAHALATMAPRAVAADTAHPLEMAAIVARASLILTPDTAAVHVASAFDVPTVALFPNDPKNLRVFAPMASRSATVAAPEGSRIADIDADEIISALDKMLEG